MEELAEPIHRGSALAPGCSPTARRFITSAESAGNGGSNVGNGHKPQLIFFASSRSGRSRRVEGYLAAVLQRRRNHETFDVVHVDVDEWPELADRLGVDSVPVLLVVEDGDVHARLENPGGAAAIMELLTPWLN